MIRAHLATDGYVVLPMGNINTFRETCHSLGTVDPLTDVRIVAGETQYPFRPAAVPFHTDHPRHDIVAWYCVCKDAVDGANLLVDTRALMERMPMSVRRLLENAQVRLPRTQRTCTILRTKPYRIYWLPPLIREATDTFDGDTTSAIASFQKELDAIASTGNVPPIMLEEGEALFVNNHAVVHGRRSIKSSSTRHLVRACVTGP